MSIRISVVIPAYNEATSLPLLLADLAEARRRYRARTVPRMAAVATPCAGSVDASTNSMLPASTPIRDARRSAWVAEHMTGEQADRITMVRRSCDSAFSLIAATT